MVVSTPSGEGVEMLHDLLYSWGRLLSHICGGRSGTVRLGAVTGKGCLEGAGRGGRGEGLGRGGRGEGRAQGGTRFAYSNGAELRRGDRRGSGANGTR